MTGSALQNLAPFIGCKPGLLAWAGWQLQVPADWRPLKLSGTPEKGWMMVGNSDCAYFSIHWQQLRGAVSDGEAWAQERLKRVGLLPHDSPPAARSFDACAWAHDVQTEEQKRTTHWYGYAAQANLLLGVKVNGVLPKHETDLVIQQVLPSLQTLPADGESRWAMYDLSFVVPAGFKLTDRHLFMGDVALRFRKSRTESLMLRQIYPGDLALARRNFERWLAEYPFVEHRRLKRSTVKITPWVHPARTDLSGIHRQGCKQLGFPLGRIMRRWNQAVVAYDPALNRLLIAEHAAETVPDVAVCEAAIARMNQPEKGSQ